MQKKIGVGRGGGGGLRFRVFVDSFDGATLAAARVKRNAFFAAAANLKALGEFQTDQYLAIVIKETTTNTNTLETYLPGQTIGTAYDAARWVVREDAIVIRQLSNAEIKAAYEANADTNAFTDALEVKLLGIETAATADQTGTQIKAAYEGEADTNAFTDALKAKLASLSSSRSAGAGVINLGVVTVGVDRLSVPAPTGYSSRYPNGTALAFSTPNPLGRTTNSINFYIGNDNYEFYGAGTGSIYFSTLETETIYYALVFGGYIQIIGPQRVKADQTGAQIKVAYEGEADTNAFTDALKTKLEGVATAATAVSIANVLAKILPGTGINVNKAVAGQITISATGGGSGGYCRWSC